MAIKLPGIGKGKRKASPVKDIRNNLIEGTNEVIDSIENFAKTLQNVNEFAQNEQITEAIEMASIQIEDLTELVKYARKGNQEILKRMEQFRDAGGFGLGVTLSSQNRILNKTFKSNDRDRIEKVALSMIKGLNANINPEDLVEAAKPEVVQKSSEEKKKRKPKVKADPELKRRKEEQEKPQSAPKPDITETPEIRQNKQEQKSRDKNQKEATVEISKMRKVLQRMLVIDEEGQVESKRTKTSERSKKTTGIIERAQHFDVFSDLTTIATRKFEKIILQPLVNVVSKGLTGAFSFLVRSPVLLTAVSTLLLKSFIPNNMQSADQLGADITNATLKTVAALGGKYAAKALVGATLGASLGPVGSIVGAAGGVALEMFGEALFKNLMGDKVFDTVSERVSQFIFAFQKFIDDNINPILKYFGFNPTKLLTTESISKNIENYNNYIKNDKEELKRRDEEVEKTKAAFDAFVNDKSKDKNSVAYQIEYEKLEKAKDSAVSNRDSLKKNIATSETGLRNNKIALAEKLNPDKDLEQYNNPKYGFVPSDASKYDDNVFVDKKTSIKYRLNSDGTLSDLREYLDNDPVPRKLSLAEHNRGAPKPATNTVNPTLEMNAKLKQAQEQALHESVMLLNAKSANIVNAPQQTTIVNNSSSNLMVGPGSPFDPFFAAALNKLNPGRN